MAKSYRKKFPVIIVNTKEEMKKFLRSPSIVLSCSGTHSIQSAINKHLDKLEKSGYWADIRKGVFVRKDKRLYLLEYPRLR